MTTLSEIFIHLGNNQAKQHQQNGGRSESMVRKRHNGLFLISKFTGIMK